MAGPGIVPDRHVGTLYGVRRAWDLFYAGAALQGAKHSALRAMAVPKAVCRPET